METLDAIFDELKKTEAVVSKVFLDGRKMISCRLPLGGIVLFEPSQNGQKMTPEQAAFRDKSKSMGIKWHLSVTPRNARYFLDIDLNADRTRAEVIRLAKEYKTACYFYELKDSGDDEAQRFRKAEEELRSMAEFLA